ncbi:bifunctional nicotinamidase/pyrazinamidase [Flavobacteriaceae bacterium F89]|uniref:Nicotinamidase n=1 Tax=Cerina litoralis TaxID=2874477 RepID=A0AAE3ESU2_9FLAO|nr:bifunctional nicotinamidase/pyrazinamidase [Cerina litoralis]MCG2459529.1 bifunctional nicotinamidase/pyrazinamidase [Cerina litoralis]
MKALLIIDVQNDFMPGGALPVPKGDRVVPVINRLQKRFDLVVATQDWHPKGHSSFASAHEEKEVFDVLKIHGLDQVLWPDHCVQESTGAEFHPQLQTSKIESIFRKGTSQEIDSYSGFYDNAHLKSTGLSGYLKDKGVSEIYIAGLAGEFCVYFSVQDALAEGFSAVLIEDATKPLDREAFEAAKIDILRKGGKIISSESLL